MDDTDKIRQLRAKFEGWMHENDNEKSFAVTAKKMCDEPNRKDGVTSAGGKSCKREENRSVQERLYYVTGRIEIEFGDASMKPLKMRENLDDLFLGDKKHNGTQSHQNCHFDPDSGKGHCAARRMPCCCDSCMEQLKKPWIIGVAPQDQDRHKENRNCEKWNLYKKENNWQIVKLEPTKKSEPLFDDMLMTILQDNAMMAAMESSIGSFGALQTIGDHSCKIFQFCSDPHHFDKKW